jgi:amino acid transporter
VASTLLGPRLGVVSGCALLIDYVLTVTVSLAAAGDALFCFVPLQARLFGYPVHSLGVPLEVTVIAVLVILNVRGLRESIIALTPIFAIFAITHLVVIVGGLVTHAAEIGPVVTRVTQDFHGGLATLGAGGMFVLFLHAYSMGAGTYTGIEAVSNGLPILREPRVRSGKRTMLYMSISLAVTAGGLLLLYLLWNVRPEAGKTMNAALLQRMTANVPGGAAFAFVTLFSEAALLVVAAQAGFVDGPRVLANMALDSWVPRRFAQLSDRLTTQNGILLIAATATLALLYTGGDVRRLVVLYSINVFLTFSLSMLGMLLHALRQPPTQARRRANVALFGVAFTLCATILVVTIVEKFTEGAWITLLVTGALVLGCFRLRRHYTAVSA